MRRQWMRAGRAAGYLVGALCTAVPSVVALPLLCLPALGGPWAQWHRRRAARLRGVAVDAGPIRPLRRLGWLPVHVVIAAPAGLLAVLCLGNIVQAAVVITSWWAFPAGARPHLFMDVPVRGWGTAVALGLAQLAVLAAVSYVLLPPLAGAHARATLAMLAPWRADRLAERVGVLTRTRMDVLEAHGAELRRIERDLHDGTQARLVAIAMRLAVARQALAGRPVPPGPPDGVSELLREAHEGVEEAMTDLRAVIRTVYPPVLADHGLAGALRMVAARGGVRVDVDVGELGRVPAAVEAVAYFAVTEALTNVARHSHATRAAVRVHRSGGVLSVAVHDDGAGGAAERPVSIEHPVSIEDRRAGGHPVAGERGRAGEHGSAGEQRRDGEHSGASEHSGTGEHGGTGLTGIRRRVEALDGTFTIASPVGGPTEITMDLPCG